jgi:hypothetical protein
MNRMSEVMLGQQACRLVRRSFQPHGSLSFIESAKLEPLLSTHGLGPAHTTEQRLGELFDLTSVWVSNRSKALVIPSDLSGASPRHCFVPGAPARSRRSRRYNLGWKLGVEMWQNCFRSLEHESYQ